MSGLTLNIVINGLMLGNSFERDLDDAGGVEIVRPYSGRTISHIVSGFSKEYGGYGGTAEVDIKCMNNGCWALDGWRQI